MLLSPHHSGNYEGFGASVLGGKKQIYFSYHITTSQLCGLIGASNQRIRLGWLFGIVFPGYLLYLQGLVSYCKAILKGLISLPSLSVVGRQCGMGRGHLVLVQSAVSIYCEQ